MHCSAIRYSVVMLCTTLLHGSQNRNDTVSGVKKIYLYLCTMFIPIYIIYIYTYLVVIK